MFENFIVQTVAKNDRKVCVMQFDLCYIREEWENSLIFIGENLSWQ
jgi:hypothetical protein